MVDAKGYFHIKLDNEAYAAARIIFKWMTGREPTRWMDHRDGDPTNNRWDNLRESTPAQNTINVSAHPMRGVHKLPSGRFEARLNKGGKYIYLGIFPSAETAHAAYDAAKQSHWGEFARR